MSFLEKVHNDGVVIQLKELLDDYPELRYYEMDRNSYPTKKINKIINSEVCSGCALSHTQITKNGHDKSCAWIKRRKNFTRLYNQLTRFEKENFEYILQELKN